MANIEAFSDPFPDQSVGHEVNCFRVGAGGIIFVISR